ncbi:MAG: cell division protein ZipA [Gammaproteobacteria bacterium]
MDNIRLILLVAGVGIIALVYFVTRYQLLRSKATHAEPASPRMNVTPEDPDIDLLAEELAEMDALVSDVSEPVIEVPRDEERLIILTVMAQTEQPFQGLNIVKALNNQSLQFGDMKIYHRMSDNQIVFSVASAVKPGVFEIGKMGQFVTPGLSLFLQLPGPVEGTAAFDDLVNTASRLAVELGGELQDVRHQSLNQQKLLEIRQSIQASRQPA